MVASDAGAMFLKAVDGSGEYKDKNYIANKILDVIKDVGAQNVVQVIIDNAPVCKAAGSIVEGVHPHIFWKPCVVHTLNLALKNICDPKNTESNEAAYSECSWISKVVDDAQLIRNFIINHSMRLSMSQQFVNLKLLAVVETRFASTIIMLKRLRVVKQGLLSMVIDEQWISYRDDDKHRAIFVKDTISNDSWWEKVDYVLSFTSPIYDMLRACDTNQPTLHLVYEKWDSMIEQVKLTIFQHENKELNQHSSFYDVVYSILIDIWTKSNTPLHCLAHSLNPRYYCEQWLEGAPNRVTLDMDNDICMERNKCLRSYFPIAKERLEAYAEIAKFASVNGELAQYDCSQHRWDLEHRDWWVMNKYSNSSHNKKKMMVVQEVSRKLVEAP
ncbi:uncharacterized protein LOC130719057 [Lotus japonicus]|uniref:uncharacterized protein LOC130719057 n=1 Tax=Lotus japonicus TaxID=34305 RepID=UPI00258D3B6A|nr:uncharacterized protein LOC130719057 [Lotus japonicus]